MSFSNNNKNIVLEHFKKFIIDNSVIGTTAGVCIALATKDLIASFVGDIILPGIIFCLLLLNIKFLQFLPNNSVFNTQNFLKQFIGWILIIIITFLFIKISFGMLIGDDEKKVVDVDTKKEPFYSY
jgi:large-conductance mechanosensitive channel